MTQPASPQTATSPEQTNSSGSLVLLIALCLSGLVVLMMFAGSGKAQQESPPIVTQPVVVAPVVYQSSYTKPYQAAGKIEAQQQAMVGFERAGRISSVLVEDGARIKTGQLLAKLDTERLDAQINELQAAKRLAEAEVRLATNSQVRVANLVKRKLDSEQRLDEVSENLNIAQARLEQITAQLASLAVETRKAELRAVTDGHVIKRLVDPGAVVGTGQPVLELASNAQLQARVPLPPEIAVNMKVGQYMTLNIAGSTVNAQLLSLGSQRNLRTRTVDALFAIPPNTSVLVGDLVTARLPTELKQIGAWLPVSALANGIRGMWTVLVAKQVGKTTLESRTIEIIFTDGEKAFVQGAVAQNDLVVVAGTHRFVPGQTVFAKLAPGQ